MDANIDLRAVDTALLGVGMVRQVVGSPHSPPEGNLVHCSHLEGAGMLHVVAVGDNLDV